MLRQWRLPSALPVLREFSEFVSFLHYYARNRGYGLFVQFEKLKDVLVDVLYKKRGKYAKPFLHAGTIAMIFVMVTVGPQILSSTDEVSQPLSMGPVLSTGQAKAPDFYTLQAEEVRQYRGGEIITHVVNEGETLSSIAARYGLQVSTVAWENKLAQKATLKPGQELRILPVDGVRHKVARGETIYSIGKKYGLDNSQVQVIVDYPFNEFVNDETFELAAGQYVVVPDGEMPYLENDLPKTRVAARLTPDAGAVSATGKFLWPAAGMVTQGYRFYHKAVDIANRAGGPILAADAGLVTVAGWVDNSGYGNRVMIDHGNGYVTLYAHMSIIQVQVGQRVGRGDVLGQMGNTGRSTGTHLHFEIRQGGSLFDPQSFF